MPNIPQHPTGGADRTVSSYLADRNGVFDLLNFRPSKSAGIYDQTPYFRQSIQYLQGTYWDGAASATEPTGSYVRGYASTNYTFSFTDYCVLRGTQQMQVFYLATQPTAETINTGCLLVINDVLSLGLTLGLTLDVEIDGATTFRWRKNGGGWTAAVPITTAGVSIDSGNATVYFLTATGFTVGHLWQWRRTDANFYDSAKVSGNNYTTQFCFRNDGTIYYTAQDNRIMAIKAAGNSFYGISAGYRAVYGRCITIFENHLVVSGYSVSQVTNAAQTLVVGWSDNVTFENFIATDTNEADQKTLDVRNPADYIVGLAVLSQQLFVVTSHAIHYSAYLGLPLVFSFKEFVQLETVNAYYPVIQASSGIYLLGVFRMFFFGGSGIETIEYPINPQQSATSNAIGTVFGCYDPQTNELCVITSGSILYVFQTTTKRWYRRAVNFNSTAFPSAIYSVNGDVTLGSISRKLLAGEWGQSLVDQPVKDTTNGTLYATPKITFHSYAGYIKSLRQEKEIKGVYLAISVNSTAVSASFYSTAANLQAQIHWYLSDTGQIAGTPTTDAKAVWVNTNSDGRIDYPRTAFRAIALEIQLNGLVANKPPFQASIFGLDLDVRDVNNPELAR